MLSKSKIFRFIIVFCTTQLFLLQNGLVQADSSGNEVGQATSLGQASINALEPISIFTVVLYNLCYILGTAFVLGSIIRYKEHRDNPSQTPLSRPIMLLIFGLILLAIPSIAKLSASANLLSG